MASLSFMCSIPMVRLFFRNPNQGVCDSYRSLELVICVSNIGVRAYPRTNPSILERLIGGVPSVKQNTLKYWYMLTDRQDYWLIF
jgi:hypothetical protein